MTFVFDARTFEPALPANDTDEVPMLRLVEAAAAASIAPRPRRFLRRGPRKTR